MLLVFWDWVSVSGIWAACVVVEDVLYYVKGFGWFFCPLLSQNEKNKASLSVKPSRPERLWIMKCKYWLLLNWNWRRSCWIKLTWPINTEVTKWETKYSKAFVRRKIPHGTVIYFVWIIGQADITLAQTWHYLRWKLLFVQQCCPSLSLWARETSASCWPSWLCPGLSESASVCHSLQISGEEWMGIEGERSSTN